MALFWTRALGRGLGFKMRLGGWRAGLQIQHAMDEMQDFVVDGFRV